MKSITKITNSFSRSLTTKFIEAIDAGDTKSSTNVPTNEIIGLASKLKIEKMAKSGAADRISYDAERYYAKKLREEFPDLFKEYRKVRVAKIKDKELNRQVFAKIEQIFPDAEIKQKYIADRMGFHIHSDRKYLIKACQMIASRRVDEEVRNLRSLFIRYSNPARFNEYLYIIHYLDNICNQILFKKQMLKILAEGFSDRRIRIIFYKCLRLTHNGGNVGFYEKLDDHIGFDKNGKHIKFIAEADFFQLDSIKNIVRKFRQLHLSSENLLLISDFDLLKFKGYFIPLQKINIYLNNLKNYFNREKIEVELDTEYFDSPYFLASFKEIWKSIDEGSRDYIGQSEFLRIERSYEDVFSKVMKDWDSEHNHYYSVNSVARNIAEGIYLSSEPTIVFVFGDSTVHGERFNLATRTKIPFLSIQKMKAKIE